MSTRMKITKFGIIFFDGKYTQYGGHWQRLADLSAKLTGVGELGLYWTKTIKFGYHEDYYDCYHCYFSFFWLSLCCSGFPKWIKENK